MNKLKSQRKVINRLCYLGRKPKENFILETQFLWQLRRKALGTLTVFELRFLPTLKDWEAQNALSVDEAW